MGKQLFFKETPVEGNALDQFEKTSQLEGVVHSVAMPDLHAGKGHPIGASFLTQGIIYPYLVGNDIGCGMSLSQLDLKSHKAKRDKLSKKINNLESFSLDEISSFEEQIGIKVDKFNSSLGTVGGGNHFVEIQTVEAVLNEEVFSRAGLDSKKIMVMTHSGSRGLGESILSSHIQNHNSRGLKEGTEEFNKYFSDHNYAVSWAKINRMCLVAKVASLLSKDYTTVLDIVHNSVSKYEEGFLHRKGTAPSDNGLVVIPGSRGDMSYLVKPLPSQNSLWSLAHGAGRKWKRGESKARLSKKYRVADFKYTDLKSQVICGDKELLYQEAPQNYKKITRVIDDLSYFGLIDVVAVLKPLITYKKYDNYL